MIDRRASIFAAGLFAVMLAAGLIPPLSALAEGALAIGVTNNVSRDGIAYGTAWNYKSTAEARDTAMRNCREYKSAQKAAANCRLIGTFTKQCFAVAFDPKVGTPGVGWAIAPTRDGAQTRAIDECQATAGRGRREFCKIDTVKCDGQDDDED